nr:ABC transporter permease [Propionicimonas sp.]
MSTALVARKSSSAIGARLKRLMKRREAAAVLATIGLIVLTGIVNPRFLTGADAIRNLWLTPSMLMVIAVAQAVVLITRNVDLSISATLGISAYATGVMFAEHPEIPDAVVVIVAILIGTALGTINGLLVSLGRIPSLVITLGTLYAYKGLLIAWAGSNRIVPSDLPDWLKELGVATIAGFPVLTVFALIILICVGYYMYQRPSGREMYAIGSSPEAAELCGLPVRRRVPVAFVISGTLAGLAGVIYAARYATISSLAGAGLEFDTVASAVIGGVSMSGGLGTVAGAAVGAALLSTIDRALPTMGVPAFWQECAVGALILAAIVLDRVLAIRNERRLRVDPADGSKPGRAGEQA